MNDWRALIDRLRQVAAECAEIRDTASLTAKRDFFGGLADHLIRLADDVEYKIIASKTAPSGFERKSADQDYVDQTRALRFAVLASRLAHSGTTDSTSSPR